MPQPTPPKKDNTISELSADEKDDLEDLKNLAQICALNPAQFQAMGLQAWLRMADALEDIASVLEEKSAATH